MHDVIYRDAGGDREALDLYLPAGPAPAGGRPVVVAIHGGGWRRFDKEQYAPTVAPLARRGFVVAIPNYRLSSPRSSSWPTNLEDVRDAVRWVREHAAELGADPGRVAAMGESAGGHLAALLGTDPGSDSARIQAVVDFYGPTDLAALDARSPAASFAIRQFLGASPAADPGRYAEASPSSHVSADDPPFLIVQGSADTLVVPSQSVDFSRRLTAAGVPNTLSVVRGAGHGFGLRIGGRNLLGEVTRFLDDAMA